MAMSLEEVLANLERSRMEAEDLRVQFVPHWNYISRVRNGETVSTWRIEFEEMQEQMDRHVDTINEVQGVVESWIRSETLPGHAIARVGSVLRVLRGYALFLF